MKIKDEKYKTELAKIEDENLKSIAKDILNEHTHLSLENGRFVCTVCKEGWSKVPRLRQEPVCTFSLHRNSKQKMEDHMKACNHKTILVANIYDYAEKIKLQEIAIDEKKRVQNHEKRFSTSLLPSEGRYFGIDV